MSYVKMNAKFYGKCHETGATIKKGEPIIYCTRTKKAFSAASLVYETYSEHKDTIDRFTLSGRQTAFKGTYYRDFNGKEYYRKAGVPCEDAPCCGCCNF